MRDVLLRAFLLQRTAYFTGVYFVGKAMDCDGDIKRLMPKDLSYPVGKIKVS